MSDGDAWQFVCLSHAPTQLSHIWYVDGWDLLETVYVLERTGNWPNYDIYEGETTIPPEPKSLHLGILERDGAPAWRAVEWLRGHPHCEIGMCSEYNVTKHLDTFTIETYIRKLNESIRETTLLLLFLEQHSHIHSKDIKDLKEEK